MRIKYFKIMTTPKSVYVNRIIIGIIFILIIIACLLSEPKKQQRDIKEIKCDTIYK